jgi:RNA exonuclease 1
MVLTTDDAYSLARISMLDWSGATMLDSFVKPALAVKNYFTQYSGITPALLSNVTTTLADIQAKLLGLLTPSTVLLGHSLESDLNAMKLTHPFIVDTSLIYPHPRGPPLRSSLKFLTQKYLRREIQVSSEKGHNSVEDALAVLDLVKLKCEKGPKWGTSEASGEPIFRRLARAIGRDNKPRTSAIVDYGTPERGYGKEATVAIGTRSDTEVVQGVSRAVNGDADGKVVPGGGVDFTWARLRELESWRGWSNNNREYAIVDALHGSLEPNAHSKASASRKGTGASPEADMRTSLGSKVGETVRHIEAIYKTLPPCTLFIVYSGTGDPREVGRLQKMQAQYKKEFKVKKWDDLSVRWTDDEEQALRKAVEKARDGCGFVCVK